ncbi:MAG: DUF2721 domain-containing protein [Sediminibacterium sp.]|jgi:hypothetical protein|nr:MAG: DUF2721 domain-containing protein [Sediminibacterium sp.]
MDISINTPALLFPAVSLVLLAYTNRFLALSNRVRSLHDKYLINPTPNKSIHQQIKNLRYRLKLIKNMQTFGVLTFITSIFCIFFIYIGQMVVANVFFALGLISFIISLFLSLLEIRLSNKAIEIELSDMEGLEDPSVIDYLKSKFE